MDRLSAKMAAANTSRRLNQASHILLVMRMLCAVMHAVVKMMDLAFIYMICWSEKRIGKKVGKCIMERSMPRLSDQPVYVMSDVDSYYETGLY